MAVRNADARWEGTLKEGKGNLKLGSGSFDGQYSFSSRFEEGTGTNPEELIAAAQAGCYSMQLNAMLERNGTVPNYVHTVAKVHLGKNDAGQNAITQIDLLVEADVPNISEEDFQKVATEAKAACLIARALGAVGNINLTATLK
jgi:osmotically inducible protein OsmC